MWRMKDNRLNLNILHAFYDYHFQTNVSDAFNSTQNVVFVTKIEII